MSGTSSRIALFVIVIAVVVSTAAIGGYAMADAPTERSDATVEKQYFTDESLVSESELTSRSGEIDLADQPSRTVLISTDGQVSELEPVIEALVTSGHEVRIHDGGGSSIQSAGGILTGSVTATSSVSETDEGLESELGEVDALLAVGGSQFSDEDYETIESFAEEGSVVLATEPATGFSGSASDGLTARFGISVGDGYLYNMQENDANYQRIYANGAAADIGAGVESLVFDTATPVASHDGSTAITASEQTRYSVTRESDTYGVAAQSGNVVVIGDTDFMTPLDYNRADNNQFIGNVLEFLTDTPENPYSPPSDESEDSTSGGAEYPTSEPEQPRPTETAP